MPKDQPKNMEELIERLDTVLNLLEKLLQVRESSPLSVRIDEMMQALTRVADALEATAETSNNQNVVAERLEQVETRVKVLTRTVFQIRDWLIAPPEAPAQTGSER